MLLFAGANIVTTTLVTGASLGDTFSFTEACLLISVGTLLGTLPIAILARLGPRYGLPSMVLLRRPFGTAGAAAISALLVFTNFAWIALNNVIAADAMVGLLGGSQWLWSLVVGSVATLVALAGPRAMALFDRIAVPLLLLVGIALTIALFGEAGREALSRPGVGGKFFNGLDIVVAYQISWSLMFADYTRFQSRERSASLSVLAGLTISSAWLMAVGAGAGIAGGGNTPSQMILGLGLPVSALLLMALSTITTNFVNIFLSSLAIKNLWPGAPERGTVLMVGTVGTLFGILSPSLLDAYAGFMGWIATFLLPIVAITLVHFFVLRSSAAETPRWRVSTGVAWAVGVFTFQGLQMLAVGATIPTLVLTGSVYFVLARRG